MLANIGPLRGTIRHVGFGDPRYEPVDEEETKQQCQAKSRWSSITNRAREDVTSASVVSNPFTTTSIIPACATPRLFVSVFFVDSPLPLLPLPDPNILLHLYDLTARALFAAELTMIDSAAIPLDLRIFVAG